MPSKAISQKLKRLALGAAPRVIDLFAGCGGLSLGFKAAGAAIAGAVECDAAAARSHGINFHGADERYCKARDITKTTPEELTSDLGLDAPADAFDILVGGPPCQAFARVGRSKLREVAEHPEAFRHDPRARLYINYLDYVKACAPLAVVMENVPDMLNHGGHNIAEEVCEVLGTRGYVCGYTLLNAAFYGVPQMRERMFLLAYKSELADEVIFPKPTNWIELPAGYDGSRAVALKALSTRVASLFASHYISPPLANTQLPAAVTVREAIEDLAPIRAGELIRSGLLRRGARRFDTASAYNPQVAVSAYAKTLKHWPDYSARDAVYDHVIRFLPRDCELFSRMTPGDQYPEAFRLAEAIFQERLAAVRSKGDEIPEGSKHWKAIRTNIVPPYDPGKFPNKWRKLEPDKPSRTLLAHIGKDTYSHIHYDDSQARTISVREAARLQSFPDGFRFSGTMNPAFRQIGNAVPPLMAQAVAETVLSQIEFAVQKRSEKRVVGAR
ncbi:MAG: DNA cytosine methyltransferase [Candidatus Angelobacter sp.]